MVACNGSSYLLTQCWRITHHTRKKFSIHLVYKQLKRNMQDMKRGFAKILVAVDGSQPSMNAAVRAISLANEYQARLTGLYVVPSNIGYGYLDDNTLSEWPAEIRRIISNAITKGEGYLDSIKEKAIENAIQFESKVILGGSSVVRVYN